MNNGVDYQLTPADWCLALGLALFALVSACFYINQVPVGAPPDEWAHITYVKEVASGDRLIPDYAGSQINGKTPNYLSHPPLYYSMLGVASRVLDLRGNEAIHAYRLISALLVAVGMLLWALAIRSWGGTRFQMLVVVIATYAVPMFPYLAGSVNNDNLVFLAVAAFFLALSLRHRLPRLSYYFGAAAVLAVTLTKATGAVFLFAFVGVWITLRLRQGENILKNRYFVTSAAILVILGGTYYAYTYLQHGTFFPHAGKLYQATYPDGLVGFGAYLKMFANSMLERLPVVMSHRSYAPLLGGWLSLFYFLFIVPLLAWLVYRPLAPPSERRDLSDAFVAALVLTLSLHVWISWKGYQQTGLLAGIQPRYYSYALPGLFAFAFIEGLGARIKQWFFGLFAWIATALIAFVPAVAMRSLTQEPSPNRQAPVALTYQQSVNAVEVTVNLNAGLAGYVDRVEVRGGRLTASGWAVEARSNTPAKLVWIVQDGRLLGAAKPYLERSDVAGAVGSGALTSGFDVTIDGLPPALKRCSVHFYAAQGSGFIELKNPVCDIRKGSAERG